MYSIALKQKQHPTYILTDQESGSRVEIVPERGGMVTEWTINGAQILYFDAERFTDPAKSVRGGIPILFPICGNLPDATYQVEGQSYELAQHGFARNLPWTVRDRAVKENGAVLELALESTPDTLSVYPFEFELVFTYRLQGDRLYIDQSYTNKSKRTMPFSTGLHPYFYLAKADKKIKSQLQLEIPASRYIDQINQTEHDYTGSLDWDAPELDLAFRPISAQQTSATDPTRALSVSIDYDSTYTTLVFWTVEEKNYYCLEPWSAPRNALNTGVDLLQLAPGETRTTNVTFNAQVAD